MCLTAKTYNAAVLQYSAVIWVIVYQLATGEMRAAPSLSNAFVPCAQFDNRVGYQPRWDVWGRFTQVPF